MLLALLGSPVARAASPSDFEAANQMYDRGDFQGAKNSYESLVHAGSFSANLFYNLGNADYRLGKKGDAFVAYERALALLPSHPEAKANLNLLRNETGALLPTVNWQEQALSWPTEVTGNRAEWLAAAAFWVFCFSLAPLFYKRRVAWIPATLSLLVLGWCGVALRWQQSRGETWIVKSPETSARVSPADTSKMAAALPVGSHVQLLLERGEWLYVLLPNENGEARGWISRAAVDPVAIRKS